MCFCRLNTHLHHCVVLYQDHVICCIPAGVLFHQEHHSSWSAIPAEVLFQLETCIPAGAVFYLEHCSSWRALFQLRELYSSWRNISQLERYSTWARDSAVGEIRCHISPELQSIATASEDPQVILKAIKAAYGKSSFATQYNMMQAFLAVKQESSEMVAAFISRTRKALHFLQSTHPPAALVASRSSTSDPIYSLDDSDHELLISVLLQGTKYTALTTSLLAQSDLTVQQVEDVLKNEEAHKTGVAAAAAAAATTPSTAAAPASTSSHWSKKPKPICAFCGRPGHITERCFKLEAASKKAKEEVSNDSSKSQSDGKANVADSTTPMESAGAASVHLLSSPSSLPDAWNADTGATSHMTPHH